jgi:DNA mismatch repair protein MutS2
MKKRIVEFINENLLSPFNSEKSTLKKNSFSIYKTTDAKKIHRQVLQVLSRKFVFGETNNLWNFFNFSLDINEILKRQKFFGGIQNFNRTYLKELTSPRKSWSPDYNIVVVTEDEATFVELQKLSCPVQLLVNENDVVDLDKYDVVQVICCEMFGGIISRLPQSILINGIEDIYLERYLEILSSWKDNFAILENGANGRIKEIVDELKDLFSLIDTKKNKIITVEEVEKLLEEINEKINSKLKEMTISGDSLVKILAEGKMPEDFEKIIQNALETTNLPGNVFSFKIPVEIDYAELEKYIHLQSATEFTNLSERIKSNSEKLKKVPEYLHELEVELLFEDFYSGLSDYLSGDVDYPTLSDNVHFSQTRNLFLNSPQPVDFQLDNFSKCSILTGANSGGKTTLIEHILQNLSLFNLGLPVSGEVHVPIFTDVYYFAKNKGSASKGAFETLLTQMSQIKSSEKGETLILADEIESVTEPGVAGKIIASTADYFIKKNCFLIVATHLGYEIQDCLPEGARIDGIEAKGLDENFDLVVDHNPVMGRLAHSTPELIVEKMASAKGGEYFEHLFGSMKKK